MSQTGAEAPNSKGGSGEVYGEWKACLAAARSQPLKRTCAHGGVSDGDYTGIEKEKVARNGIGMEMGMESWVSGIKRVLNQDMVTGIS